jgi:hypothetical protein
MTPSNTKEIGKRMSSDILVLMAKPIAIPEGIKKYEFLVEIKW